uniref:ATP synthase F0 subunit 6 n=1 Tax=Chandlerella quiscali TaxID=871019 RepID=E1AK31_9BILA|nr:ATP synthase F0 subunit 6 [Chandlerella quiscali]ADL39032.1 ATP synthase F0 subunit 6 [Chandlerella quiscali]
MLFLFLIWFCLFFYMFYLEWFKFFSLFFGYPVLNVGVYDFQSTFFFKFMVVFFSIFWLCGLFFPLFSPWVCFWFLFILASFSWLGVRIYTMASDCFLVFFDKSHFWNWYLSLFMFISHLLGFFMSGVALIFRISIVFLVGHFLMFSVLNLNFSFFFLLFIIPIELLFAFLQSYIFLILIRMFLLCMI